jgi:hypothetical protein
MKLLIMQFPPISRLLLIFSNFKSYSKPGRAYISHVLNRCSSTASLSEPIIGHYSFPTPLRFTQSRNFQQSKLFVTRHVIVSSPESRGKNAT